MTTPPPVALVVSGDPYIRAGIRAQLAGEALEVVGESEPETWDTAAEDMGAEVVFWDGAGPTVERDSPGPSVVSLVDDEDDARKALASGSSAVSPRPQTSRCGMAMRIFAGSMGGMSPDANGLPGSGTVTGEARYQFTIPSIPVAPPQAATYSARFVGVIHDMSIFAANMAASLSHPFSASFS